ncbi:flagellar biosynthetic protein FliR [Ideonella oryzae]|uniref:Flagellar biosynthetic protein FliR n=1 Tax=Ideonella oryzae TaxID=2937441 RepID=A0ABT1BLH3_9BURK|nr:flagellar biosynthetic protein FliR [Ideonella oryzae]MCO5977056.1 flagellar biosynthetic protein FliR [Ideonella oryzae]
MEPLLLQLPALLTALWWPFCRSLAVLSMAPVLGEAMVPVTVRILLSLVLGVILMPVAAQGAVPVDPFSLQGLAATVEQAVIGLAIGLALQLALAAFQVLGYLASSQMGLAMAVMNDPLNGSASDAVSNLVFILCTLVFFAVDGHLVVTGVLGASFKAWPVGAGWGSLSLQTLALQVGWVFSAAMLLALPLVFSTLVVQIGFGFLNRVAPTMNLFSLGFSVVTLFGVLMLWALIPALPTHYLQATQHTLDLLQQGLMQAKEAPHGG